MIQLGYGAITDARSDWLTVETLFIANRLGVEISEPAELSRKIRKVFIDQTERLAAMALEKNEITYGDVADAIRMHYTVLPRGMFNDVQPPRNKSQEPVKQQLLIESPKVKQVKTMKGKKKQVVKEKLSPKPQKKPKKQRTVKEKRAKSVLSDASYDSRNSVIDILDEAP